MKLTLFNGFLVLFGIVVAYFAYTKYFKIETDPARAMVKQLK